MNKRRLLAVFYDDGIVADLVLSELGYALRKHMAISGLVQRNTFRRDRRKCDMELEELGSGRVFQLSEDRGKFAAGCRLDREAIVNAATQIAQGLKEPCDLLIINKFGRTEAEGRGLREVIGEAIERGIPTIIGVPRRNSDAWQEFAGEFSDRCEVNNTASLLNWIRNRTAFKGVLVAESDKDELGHLFSQVA